jgi:hypothetical protein
MAIKMTKEEAKKQAKEIEKLWKSKGLPLRKKDTK